MKNIYDIAVIGGGITGLTTAALYKKESPESRVILFEKNSFLGGLAGTEQINSFLFDSVYLFPDISIFLKKLGIDYRCYKYKENVFRFVNAENNNHWEIDIPYDTDKLRKHLIDAFPEDKKSIEKFLDDSLKINDQFNNLKTKLYPLDIIKLLTKSGKLLANLNKDLKSYLAKYKFKNNNLLKILHALSGLANLPPEKLNSVISLVGFSSLQKGAYRQNESFNELIKLLKDKALNLGVDIKVKSNVDKITKDKYGFKISAEDKIFYSKKIINSVSTKKMFLETLDRSLISPHFLNKIENIRLTHSAFIMRIIIKDNKIKYPTDIGQILYYSGENTFSYLYDLANNNKSILNDDKFHFAFAIREQSQKFHYAIELLSIPVSYKYWQDIFDGSKNNYHNEIKKWEDFFIKKMENHFDGYINKKIVLKKSFTPIDLKNTFGLYNGSIYDMAYINSQSGTNRLMFKTPVKNFYNCKLVHGVYGSFFQSFLIADYLLNGKINDFKYSIEG